MIRAIFTITLAFFYLTLFSQVYNPYLKLEWKDSTDHNLYYGELTYSDSFEMDIHLDKDAFDSNEQASKAFVEDFIEEFKSLPSDRQNIFFYIHGFGAHNSSYLERNNTAIQKDILNREYSDIGVHMSLSWSAGYIYLRTIPRAVDLGKYYGSIMTEVIKEAKKVNPSAKVNLMTHSMGNRVFIGVFEVLKKNFKYAVIDQHIMAAPDIEPDVFKEGQPLADIEDVSKNVTIYRHNRDMVLSFSSKLSGNKRLGLEGLNQECLDDCQNIKVVDCSLFNDVDRFDIGNHNYYYQSPTVRKDIYNILFDQSSELENSRKKLEHERRLVLQFPTKD